MRQRGSGSYHMKASLCCVIDFHLSLRLFCFTANPSSVFDPKTSAVPVCQSPFSSSSLLHSVSLSFYPHYKQRPNFSWAQDRVGSCYFRGGKDGKLCVTRYAWNRICMTCPPATLLFQVADLDKMIGLTAGNVPFRDVNILSAFVARPDHVVAVKNKRKKGTRLDRFCFYWKRVVCFFAPWLRVCRLKARTSRPVTCERKHSHVLHLKRISFS